MKPRTDKQSRLSLTAEEGRRLGRFLQDSAIQRLFADLEVYAIENMIAAASPADREREALRIQVIRALKSDLEDRAARAERAVKEMETVTHA
jgi:hypothetical protein